MLSETTSNDQLLWFYANFQDICRSRIRTSYIDNNEKQWTHFVKSFSVCGQAFIPNPVVAVAIVIHLGSDGYTPVNTETKYMHVDLITAGNQTVPVEQKNIPVTCWENPIHVTIKQDLSLPFTLTRGKP